MRLAWRLVREPAVPGLVKIVPFVAAVYVLSPLDMVPDLLPVLGQLDDLGLVLVAVQRFVKWCPPSVVDFHRSALASGAAYRRMPVQEASSM